MYVCVYICIHIYDLRGEGSGTQGEGEITRGGTVLNIGGEQSVFVCARRDSRYIYTYIHSG